jgi:DNA-directed RNA polymerase specialized sigma24 family protein
MDASIVREIQGICRSASRELLRTISLQGSAFCYVDEDDFIQEGFVKALELYPAYDPSIGSLVGFLTTPIRNHLKNYLDRLFRGQKAFKEAWIADHPNPNFDERRTVDIQRQ